MCSTRTGSIISPSPSNDALPFPSAHPSDVAMRDDARRTPKFKVAIQQRLSGTSGQVVMDVGTGPFALLALMAARAGAAKVYAVESNPEAAKRARQAVAEAKDVAPGVVEIIEGYSTEVTLPQKADLVLAEIVGSVASEEGLCATILDVQRRHAKRPNDPRSFIPNRVQTWCAPASYALHYALGPPEFDCKCHGGVGGTGGAGGVNGSLNSIQYNTIQFNSIQFNSTRTPAQINFLPRFFLP
jgi:SAM-dependent methyltransferase